MRIHEQLQDGRVTNCSKLARELEVSTKTIMRDLAFMRDQLNLPVDYDPQIYAWRYSYPVKSFPTVQVSEGELLALLVAQKALAQYQGTPYHGQLAHAFAKLTERLRDRVSFSSVDSLSSISFHHLGLGRADLKIFGQLSRAVMQGLEIKLVYKRFQSAEAENRRIQPYHLANRDNSWYLVGFDLDRKALRNFAVGRIQGITVTTGKFSRPADFSAEKHFAKAFGAFVGSGDHCVVIRFAAGAATQVQERFWHETQEIKELSGGRLEFTMQLDNLSEIQSWVLGWGADAVVIGPPELKAAIQSAAKAVSKLY